jgi:hypothetical protein
MSPRKHEDFDVNVENNIRKDLNEMGWKCVEWRASCCECRQNEYFCSLDFGGFLFCLLKQDSGIWS